MSIQNLAPAAPQRAADRRRARSVATVGALAFDLTQYQQFLLLLGAFFVPLFGVLVADWVQRGFRYTPRDVFEGPRVPAGDDRRVAVRLRCSTSGSRRRRGRRRGSASGPTSSSDSTRSTRRSARRCRASRSPSRSRAAVSIAGRRGRAPAPRRDIESAPWRRSPSSATSRSTASRAAGRRSAAARTTPAERCALLDRRARAAGRALRRRRAAAPAARAGGARASGPSSSHGERTTSVHLLLRRRPTGDARRRDRRRVGARTTSRSIGASGGCTSRRSFARTSTLTHWRPRTRTPAARSTGKGSCGGRERGAARARRPTSTARCSSTSRS